MSSSYFVEYPMRKAERDANIPCDLAIAGCTEPANWAIRTPDVYDNGYGCGKHWAAIYYAKLPPKPRRK